MSRVLIIHGWDGYPEECWFPWLKTELEAKGFNVYIPQLPHPDQPLIEDWVPFIANQVVQPDAETFLVGHSTGCKAILIYLQSLPTGSRIGGVILVGAWLKTLKTLDKEEPGDQIVARSWLAAPLHWEKIRSVNPKTIGIYSDNDPYVDITESEMLKEKLGATIVIEHDKGHMGNDVGCIQLPSAREALDKLMQTS